MPFNLVFTAAAFTEPWTTNNTSPAPHNTSAADLIIAELPDPSVDYGNIFHCRTLNTLWKTIEIVAHIRPSLKTSCEIS